LKVALGLDSEEEVVQLRVELALWFAALPIRNLRQSVRRDLLVLGGVLELWEGPAICLDLQIPPLLGLFLNGDLVSAVIPRIFS